MRFFKVVLASALGYLLAAFIVIFLTIAFIMSIASSAKPEVKINHDSVLNLKLNYPIEDRTNTNDPFMVVSAFDPNLDVPVGLNDILNCIEHAKTDDDIKGIVLDLSGIQAGYGKISEIRTKLNEFRETGKFVYAFADYYYFTSYYLASAADSVFINPEGEMLFNGLSAEVTFFANTLKKLGVDMQVIRHGKYKGAVESYVRESLSPENREQISAYINSVFNTVVGEMAVSRNKSFEEMKSDADQLKLRSNDDFIAANYIDAKVYRDEFYAQMKKRMGLDSSDKVELVTLHKYNKLVSRSGSGERIAVVYASGDIVGGKGDGQEIGADAMAKTLKKLREDDDIKAVVFRIDSRGGSSLASDIIWREARLLSETKPLIVSMSDVAASGGYYISAPASKIVANATTITGSIGVFGLIPNAKKLLNEHLGVNVEYVNTGEYSDIGRVDRALKPEEKEYITEIVERIYQQFINKVSDGRNLTVAQVDSIGQGRVWTGAMAKEIGLVDELGGLEVAIALAASEAGLEEYRVREYPHFKDPIQQFISQMQYQSQLESTIERSSFALYLKSLLDAQKWGSQHSVQMLMPYDLNVKAYQLH
ncbi:signal peptide peptidase SppA [bacterium]|nr:signal peptide peptidase SppA [bacterium]